MHYQQALDIRISLLGQNHPSIATTLNNLGELHRTIGANEEADSRLFLLPHKPSNRSYLNKKPVLNCPRGWASFLRSSNTW
ncbi:MAG: tetratricopeptide repeat protein [Bacteroidota bacterium]